MSTNSTATLKSRGITFTTIIFFTDAITALVRAAWPLHETLQDAGLRGDESLTTYLRPVYAALLIRLKECVSAGRQEHGWTANELSAEDAHKLAQLVAPREEA